MIGDAFRTLFDTSGFPPRWWCGQWTPLHGWTHVVSDVAIFLAYAAIPLLLVYFIVRRRDVPFHRIFWLFAAFILSCGITHLIEARIFWQPIYRVSAVMKAVTAVVSWATVVALVPTIPRLLALPKLELDNRQLQSEVQEHRRTAQELLAQVDKSVLVTAIVELSEDAILTKTLDGVITFWNRGAEVLYGYPAAEAVGRHVHLIVPPDLYDEEARLVATVGRGGRIEPYESVRVRKDGDRRQVSLSLSAVKDASGNVLGVASIARDMTAKVQAETLKVQAETLFRRVFDAARSGMVMIDAGGRVVLANPAAEAQFGYSTTELAGQPVEALIPERYRVGHPALRANYFAQLEGRPVGTGRDVAGLRKDGSEFLAEVALTPVEAQGKQLALATIVDVTERQAAADKLESQRVELERSNRELEQFAYVASHDLQEPLRMVVSFTELMEQRNRGKFDDKTDKYIGYVVEGGKRMQQLVNDLLLFSRVGRKEKPFQRVETAKVVGHALLGLRAAVQDSGGRVDVSDLPAVRGDDTQLLQLFQNLIGNAIKFRSDAPPVVRVTAEQQGRNWQFCVADNGIGIDMKFADRIFQMFQRLHERDKYPGNGIGLALVKKIVERHGGRIWLESERGIGTRFFFTLPAWSEARP